MRNYSDQLKKELDEKERQLLESFKRNCDASRYLIIGIFEIFMFNGNFRFFERNDSRRLESSMNINLQSLQESIIDKIKALIINDNKIIQEEAKYNYLKNCLTVQNFILDTLPRPNPTRRKMRTQTAGLPTLFGGSLEEYYEATAEKVPLIVESCIKYINMYGMYHQGIFRVGGAHVSIT